VAKSQALVGSTARDKPKDAYDIVWLIESWPGGSGRGSDRIRRAPGFAGTAVEPALASIREAFSRPDRVGARSYARFVAMSVDEEAQLERRAAGAVREFLEALG